NDQFNGERGAGMTIKVEFEPQEVYGGYDKTLADLILDACVTRLLEDFQRDEAFRDISARVRSIRDDILAESLRETVQGALTAALQPTDSFGNAKGEPKTLQEIITTEA